VFYKRVGRDAQKFDMRFYAYKTYGAYRLPQILSLNQAEPPAAVVVAPDEPDLLKALRFFVVVEGERPLLMWRVGRTDGAAPTVVKKLLNGVEQRGRVLIGRAAVEYERCLNVYDALKTAENVYSQLSSKLIYEAKRRGYVEVENGFEKETGNPALYLAGVYKTGRMSAEEVEEALTKRLKLRGHFSQWPAA